MKDINNKKISLLFYSILGFVIYIDIQSHSYFIISELISFSGLIITIIILQLQHETKEFRNYIIVYYAILISVLFFIQAARYYKSIFNISFNTFIILYSAIYVILIIIYFLFIKKIRNIMLKNAIFMDNVNKESTLGKCIFKKFKKNIAIYLLNSGNISATAEQTRNCIKIYIQEQIYNQLDQDELSLLILHELAHIKHKDSITQMALYASSIFFFIMIVFVTILSYSFKFQFIISLFIFSYFFLSIILYNRIQLYKESRADRFALKVINNKNAMISLLDKAYEFVISNAKPKEIRPTMKFKYERMKKIKVMK